MARRETIDGAKTVVVLGVARSGTSVTAGVLTALGVDLGSTAFPTESNPTGVLEDDDFARLHKEILNAAEPGKTYWDPPPVQKVWQQQERFADRIEKLVAAKSKGKPFWGWKHPPTILTIELYLPYLVNPHFVFVFRNPLGTARSSVEHTSRYKDKVDVLRTLKLVNFYHDEMMRFVDRHPDLPALFLSFEDVLSEPGREAARIAEFLGVELTEEKLDKILKLVIPREAIGDARKKAAGLFTGKLPRLLKKKLLPLLRAGSGGE
ncbi:MAG TPA: sulfotransferase [Candidatus Binatia bacterium]|jgi:hypothetical protein